MPDEGHDYGELMVVQHRGAPGLGELASLLEDRADRRRLRVADIAAGDELPELTDQTRGILVLGGPMSLTETEPWVDLGAELELLLAAVYAEVPVFGICVGAELLATALGGDISPCETPTVGFHPLTREQAAEDDTVFAGWPDGSAVLLAQADDVSGLPAGAEAMLANSAGIPAFRATDGHSYGVQFHPEIGPEQLQAWLDNPEVAGVFDDADIDRDELVEESERREVFSRAVGVSLVGRWVDEVVGAGDPKPG